MRRTFRGPALAIACLLAAGGCSAGAKKVTEDDADDRPTVAVTAQSMDPQQAQAAVVQELTLLAQGDWAGVWTLWSDAAQAQLPQQTYVDLLSTCGQQPSANFTVTDVKATDPKTVVVKWTAGAPGQTTAVYEDGAWHISPDPAALTAYQAGRCS